jgi:iron complex outermembrane receptor protein
MKKIGLCLVLIATQVACLAQVNDSIVYPEVRVEAQRISEAIGSSVSETDSLLFKLLQSQGLTKVLQTESFISTRSYSPGGIANYSVRGSGSQHTQVVWNGIPINDPMLGQTDLSVVALNGLSNVRVLYGSAGLTNNSGGIGGTIELIPTKARTKDGLDAKLNTYAGSFGNYGISIQLRDKFKMLFGTTMVSYRTTKNNFPYEHLATLVDKQRVMEHARVQRIGFSKSVGVNINAKNSLEARVNYSQAGRELPATMLMASTKEELFDRDIWASLKWQRLGNRSRLSVTASYIYGKQEYFDNNEYTFNHLYQASKNLIRYKLYLPYRLQLELGGDVFAEYSRSDSAYRSGTHWRQWQAAFASLKYLPKKWVSAQILVREDVIDGSFSPVQGLVGVEVKPTKWFFLKGNVSRNFRTPTLNDLYWKPGGNQDLKSETGFSWEAGLGFRTASKKLSLKFDATYFQSEIDNWIIWLPAGSVWTPQNKRAVTAKGVEAKLTTSVKVGKAIFRLNTAYTWVQSQVSVGASESDNSVDKQLIYVPEHQAKGQFSVHFGKLFMLYGHEFTGMRYTTSDNESSLPSYQLGFASFGYEHTLNKHSVGITFTVDNLFDKAYQSIAWRPMPGRSFLINLNYQFL